LNLGAGANRPYHGVRRTCGGLGRRGQEEQHDEYNR
jgi:hypothetical protein